MKSLTSRVALLLCIALLLPIIGLYIERNDNREFHLFRSGHDVVKRAELFVEMLEVADDGTFLPPSEQALEVIELGDEDVEWAVFDDDERRVLGTGREPVGPYQLSAYDLEDMSMDGSLVMSVARARKKVGEKYQGFTVTVTRRDILPALLDPVDVVLWFAFPLFLLWMGIQGGLLPLHRASRRLESGQERIDVDSVPTEIRPFAERINTLFDQQQETLDRERQFTGNVAHELRTPLSVLQMGLQLLGRRIGEHQQETVTDLRETVDEMSTLVENLLSLSRSESAQAQSAVEVAPIVETVWARLEDQADARGLTFESTLEAGDTIHASEDGLRAILSNLLSNAVEYTEAGGHIVVERPADGLLAVWDSGPVPDQLDRMFDRLWRADEARSDATKHAGLGLSIARSLAESMGLELVADAPAKGGLRFLLRQVSG